MNLSATSTGQECLPDRIDQNWSVSTVVSDQRLLQISLSTFKAIKSAVNTLKSWQDKSSIRRLFRLEMPTSIDTLGMRIFLEIL